MSFYGYYFTEWQKKKNKKRHRKYRILFFEWHFLKRSQTIESDTLLNFKSAPIQFQIENQTDIITSFTCEFLHKHRTCLHILTEMKHN